MQKKLGTQKHSVLKSLDKNNSVYSILKKYYFTQYFYVLCIAIPYEN